MGGSRRRARLTPALSFLDLVHVRTYQTTADAVAVSRSLARWCRWARAVAHERRPSPPPADDHFKGEGARRARNRSRPRAPSAASQRSSWPAGWSGGPSSSQSRGGSLLRPISRCGWCDRSPMSALGDEVASLLWSPVRNVWRQVWPGPSEIAKGQRRPATQVRRALGGGRGSSQADRLLVPLRGPTSHWHGPRTHELSATAMRCRGRQVRRFD